MSPKTTEKREVITMKLATKTHVQSLNGTVLKMVVVVVCHQDSIDVWQLRVIELKRRLHKSPARSSTPGVSHSTVKPHRLESTLPDCPR